MSNNCAAGNKDSGKTPLLDPEQTARFPSLWLASGNHEGFLNS